jgi:AcrR family transcriptional regulator
MPGFTRQIILHTLTELMNEKPLSKITVKDIVERCGVNRNTFYYHFRDIPDAVEAMVKEELNDILKDQKVPESVSDCMEILVNAVQKNKKAMIHLYRSIQRDVFADYLDHAAERVVEELINRAVGDFEMDQEDRHLISQAGIINVYLWE